MKLRFALAFAGAALAVTGAAHAQDRSTAATETPWYERFSLQGEQTAPVPGASANWRINGRWGVTVDVPAERPAPLTPLGPRQETAFGGVTRADGQEEEPDAAVRIRSAFRF